MRTLSALVNFFLPNTCVLCHTPTTGAQHNLCAACQLRANHFRCTRCAIPLKTSDKLCGTCQKKPPPWRLAIAPLDYSAGTRFCIHQLKYQRKTYLAKTLASQFIMQLPKETAFPDFIIPVPLHKKKLHERHFNQSYLLAKFIGKTLRIPVKPNLCHRIKHTESQTGKTAKERVKNLRGAFHAPHANAIKDKHVVVLDDVYTTGATLKALCNALQKHKPKQIDVWCMARVHKN